jgi:anti-sigma factor (TIGR02949 family)
MSATKNVGGLDCFEVLEHLSDYLDGDVVAATKAKIEAHLAGCDECTRFGGEFGAVVKALRATLAKDDAPAAASARLTDALSR